MKRDGQKLDEDNVCRDWMGSYVVSFRSDDPGRFRFFDIMANRLNMRRAIRELALPQIQTIQAEVKDLREQVRALTAMLTGRTRS
jgi:hypothetical protein